MVTVGMLLWLTARKDEHRRQREKLVICTIPGGSRVRKREKDLHFHTRRTKKHWTNRHMIALTITIYCAMRIIQYL